MICSYCYETNTVGEFDVSKWWNNPPDSVWVCSKKCYNELEKLVKEGTWMDHKPKAIFGKKKHTTSPNFEKKKPQSITDKQFTGDLGKFMT